MIQKAEIIVEQFAQGITVRWRDIDGLTGPSKALAAHGVECSVIGKEIWEDVLDILSNTLTDKVRIKLEYEAMEED